jgi:hypothetical protein
MHFTVLIVWDGIPLDRLSLFESLSASLVNALGFSPIPALFAINDKLEAKFFSLLVTSSRAGSLN